MNNILGLSDTRPLIEQDVDFIKTILPDHYNVVESNIKGSIHCKSDFGIRKGVDSEDDEHWGYIMQAIKKRFLGRLNEVFHNVNFCHTDFTIYLRTEPNSIAIH